MSENPPSRPALRILVVDDEANIRMTLSMCLAARGHHVVTHGTIEAAMETIARVAFDLIFLDLRLGMQNGLDYIPELLRQNPWTRIVVITAYASVETAVEAMKRGASDYLPKPFEAAQVLHVTQKVAERRQLERRLEALQAALGEMDPESDLPTSDPAMLAALELARHLARSRANLIVRGEVGTGKGRLARAIHVWSDRAAEPFAVVCCRADRGDAVEAVLFGTAGDPGGGADARSVGKVEFCDGGTLVLDEVGELPLPLQPSLLGLLKDKEFQRRDEHTRRRSDVRIIATTSTDLRAAVDAGTFRGDLLLALDVVQIDLPPLRERLNDIPLLADRYLAHFARLNRRTIGRFGPEAMYALMRHTWPGNVRELRNVIERAVLLCDGEVVGVQHLPVNLLNGAPPHISIGDLVPLAAVEEWHVRRVVASTRSLRQAASVLGIDSGTVVRRLKRYGSQHDDQPAA